MCTVYPPIAGLAVSAHVITANTGTVDVRSRPTKLTPTRGTTVAGSNMRAHASSVGAMTSDTIASVIRRLAVSCHGKRTLISASSHISAEIHANVCVQENCRKSSVGQINVHCRVKYNANFPLQPFIFHHKCRVNSSGKRNCCNVISILVQL